MYVAQVLDVIKELLGLPNSRNASAAADGGASCLADKGRSASDAGHPHPLNAEPQFSLSVENKRHLRSSMDSAAVRPSANGGVARLPLSR